MLLASMEIKNPKVLNKYVRSGGWEQMKRTKETRVNPPKPADHKLQIKKKKTNITQKINSSLEDSAPCPMLFNIFISNLN